MDENSQSGSDTKHPPKDCRRPRRDVLRSIGVAVGSLVGPGASEASAKALSTVPESFRVQGNETVRTHITPNEIQIKRRRVSSNLKERYGRASFVTTETRPRPENHADDLPQRDTRIARRPWDTYYAKEDEWKGYLIKRNKATTEISQKAVGRPADCPKWYYESVASGYERKGPMNIVGMTADKKIDGIVSILQSWGWTDDVIQYNRFAWVPQRAQFEQQHRSAATDPIRPNGGYHVKFWATGDTYTTITAHEDNAIPHKSVS